jgi:hypothetical protein
LSFRTLSQKKKKKKKKKQVCVITGPFKTIKQDGLGGVEAFGNSLFLSGLE